MLPEHYCDYLLTLYSKGEDIQESVERANKSKSLFTDELIFNCLFLIIISLSLVLTYFTHFSFALQTGILTIFGIFLFLSILYYQKNGKKKLIIYITAAFLLLLYMVQINKFFFHSEMNNLYTLLLINCLLWVVAGIWRKIPFFTISGFVAVSVLLFFLVT